MAKSLGGFIRFIPKEHQEFIVSEIVSIGHSHAHRGTLSMIRTDDIVEVLRDVIEGKDYYQQQQQQAIWQQQQMALAQAQAQQQTQYSALLQQLYQTKSSAGTGGQQMLYNNPYGSGLGGPPGFQNPISGNTTSTSQRMPNQRQYNALFAYISLMVAQAMQTASEPDDDTISNAPDLAEPVTGE